MWQSFCCHNLSLALVGLVSTVTFDNLFYQQEKVKKRRWLRRRSNPVDKRPKKEKNSNRKEEDEYDIRRNGKMASNRQEKGEFIIAKWWITFCLFFGSSLLGPGRSSGWTEKPEYRRNEIHHLYQESKRRSFNYHLERN